MSYIWGLWKSRDIAREWQAVAGGSVHLPEFQQSLESLLSLGSPGPAAASALGLGSGEWTVASGGLETGMGQGRPWKSRAVGSSKAKPLETSLGSAKASVANGPQPRRLLCKSPTGQQGQLLAGDALRCISPLHPLQRLQQGLRRWLQGDSHPGLPRGSRTQPELWPPSCLCSLL